MLAALMNGSKILASDPAWDDRKEEYRAICNENAVCPICNEPIICKFGEINVHHFAHRHNSNCVGDHDTAEHMAGKMMLYSFFQSRFEHEAIIDIEHYFPEIKMTCDFLIMFEDGKQWAVEFHCGINKRKELKTKIAYYREQNIKVTWLLSKELYKDFENSEVKIAGREQLLILNTGVDKFHIEDWYEDIVIKRHRRSLPTDKDSLGSLMYLDVKQKEVTILRAICKGSHINTFYYGAMLSGSLDEILMSFNKNKWGIVWYFQQEKELGPKFKETINVLQDLESKYQEEQKRKAEAEAKKRLSNKQHFSGNAQRDVFGANSVKNHQEKASGMQQNNYYEDDGWKKIKHSSPGKYRCVHCGRLYDFDDMVIIPQYNKPMGTCRECSRKGLKGRI